jgi:hypothetical protein
MRLAGTVENLNPVRLRQARVLICDAIMKQARVLEHAPDVYNRIAAGEWSAFAQDKLEQLKRSAAKSDGTRGRPRKVIT